MILLLLNTYIWYVYETYRARQKTKNSAPTILLDFNLFKILKCCDF